MAISEQKSLNDYKQKRIAHTAAKVEVVSMKQQDFRIHSYSIYEERKKIYTAE